MKFSKPGELIGIVGVYVDDWLIVGNSEHSVWKQAIKQVNELYKWTPWEHSKFVFTGVEIEQKPNGAFKMTQEHYTNR